MNRVRITRSRPVFKYFMILVTLFSLYILASYINDVETVLISGAVAATSFIAAYRSYYAAIIEFDDENMYVTGKRSDVTVPIENVASVRLTSIQFNAGHFWEIRYYDSLNDEQTLRLLPKYKNFSLFLEKVKQKNPEAEIKDSYGIFGLGGN
jgi:hypothetical protein